MNRAGSRPHYGKIISIENLTPEIVHCRVLCEHDVTYQPGQYCMVDVENTARAFSFASLSGTKEVEFLINTSLGGPASRFFRAANVGDDVSFGHPSGDFLLDPKDSRPLLYIAGGVGLAPIMAHLLWLAIEKTERPVTLLVGHRTATAVFWDEKLSHFANEHGFTYTSVVGPLIPHLANIENLPAHSIYLCGSAGMCTNVAEALYNMGVKPAHVHYELFT